MAEGCRRVACHQASDTEQRREAHGGCCGAVVELGDVAVAQQWCHALGRDAAAGVVAETGGVVAAHVCFVGIGDQGLRHADGFVVARTGCVKAQGAGRQLVARSE